MAVRVASVNLCTESPHRRLGAVWARFLERDVGADIYLMQEVYDREEVREGANMAARIAREGGWRVVGANEEMHTCILTRLPATEERGACVTLSSPRCGDVRVTSVHLPDDDYPFDACDEVFSAAERAARKSTARARALREALDGAFSASPLPGTIDVVGGDFNASLHWPAPAWLMSEMSFTHPPPLTTLPTWPAPGWYDLWRPRDVDHIFYRNALLCDATLLTPPVIRGICMSDHTIPVVELRPRV